MPDTVEQPNCTDIQPHGDKSSVNIDDKNLSADSSSVEKRKD
jgi:hypothetical protein